MLITLLDARSQAFINKLVSAGRSTKDEVSLGLARYLAYSVSLPSEEVQDIEAFYRLNHYGNIITAVSTINELVLLDTDRVFELTRSLYAFRYSTAFGCSPAVSSKEGLSIPTFLGLHRHLSTNDCDVINLHGNEIAINHNEFKHLLGCLKKEVTPSSDVNVEQTNQSNRVVVV